MGNNPIKFLKFRHTLAQKIISGRKTVTWRLFDDKDIKVGDKIDLVDWESNEQFAKAKITQVREKKLGDINDNDFEGHEKFEGKEQTLATYREYYGDKVNLDTPVKIIAFKLI